MARNAIPANEQDDLLALVNELNIEDLKANFSDIMEEIVSRYGDDEEEEAA